MDRADAGAFRGVRIQRSVTEVNRATPTKSRSTKRACAAFEDSHAVDEGVSYPFTLVPDELAIHSSETTFL